MRNMNFCGTKSGLWGCGVACALWVNCGFAITQVQFVEKVLQQGQLLEEAQIGLDIKQIELDASRKSHAGWKAELTASYGGRRQELDRDTNSTYVYEQSSTDRPRSVGFTLSKRFLGHAGSFSLGARYRKEDTVFLRYNQRTPRPEGEVTNHEESTERYLRYTYPFLKHDSGESSLRTYRRNIVDLSNQELQFLETKEDFLADQLTDYLEWVLLHQQAEIERAFLREVQQITAKDKSDQALRNSSVEKAKADIADTSLRLQGVREKFAVLLDEPGILNETPRYDLRQRAYPINGDLKKYLNAHSRDLKRIALGMELERMDTAYYKNQLLPSLNLQLERRRTQLESLSGSRGTTERDDILDNFSATLTFSYPIGGSITNRTELEKSRLGMRKLEISYAEKQQDLVADIRELEARLAQSPSQALDSVAAATVNTPIVRDGYTSGKNSLRDLLEAYEDERDARLKHLETMVDYQVDRIDYDNLLDQMLLAQQHTQTPTHEVITP